MLSRREVLAGMAAAALFPHATGESRMDQRISVVTLGVRSLEAARRFYGDGLGWKAAFQNQEISFFQCGGMILALFPRDGLAEDMMADPATFGRAAISLGYNVREKNEVDPLLRRAVAAGAKILKPGRDASWGGYSGYFADPDGYAWEVAWNPQWRLAADGNIYVH